MVVREDLPTDAEDKIYEENYDGMQYLKWWKNENATEYSWMLDREEDRASQMNESTDQYPASQT